MRKLSLDWQKSVEALFNEGAYFEVCDLILQGKKVTFYECPHEGDEAPLLTRLSGIWYETDYWDRPSVEEVLDNSKFMQYVNT